MPPYCLCLPRCRPAAALILSALLAGWLSLSAHAQLGPTGTASTAAADGVSQLPGPLVFRAQLGGTSHYHLTVAGRHGYLAAGLQLTVLDLAARARLRPLGSVSLASFAERVVVSGTVAYVAEGGAGLALVDAGDPARPRLAGSLDTAGSASDVAVFGTSIAVADGNGGLVMVDAANPGSPRQAGVLGGIGSVLRVAAAPGGIVYAVTADGQLRAVDVADVRSPLDLGIVNTGGLAVAEMAVGGSSLYLSGRRGASGVVQVVDVADPRQPRLAGGLAVQAAGALSLVGHRLYLRCADTVCILDVTDPEAPRQIGSYVEFEPAFESTKTSIRQPEAVAGLDGDVLLVMRWGESAIVQVVDTAEPSSPRAVAGSSTFEFDQDMVSADGLAYVIGSDEFEGDQFLRVFDLQDPLQATELAKTKLPAAYHRLAVAGRTVVLADSEGIALVDVSDPRSPSLGGKLEADSVQGVVAAGDRVYLGVLGGVQTVDISDVRSPKRISTCSVESVTLYGGDIAVDGNRLLVEFERWVTTNNSSLLTHAVAAYDLSDGGPCRRIGAIDMDDTIIAMAVAGDAAFVSTVNSGLVSLDLADPRGLVHAGQIDPNYVSDLARVDDRLYAMRGLDLHVFDLSDPRRPQSRQFVRYAATDWGSPRADAMSASRDAVVALGNSRLIRFDAPPGGQVAAVGGMGLDDLAWPANRVWAAGSVAMVNSASEEMRIIDTSVASSPSVVGVPRRPAGDVAFVGTNAYLLHGGTLHVLDLSDEAHPLPIRVPQSLSEGQIAVRGNWLVVAGRDGLRVFDLGDTYYNPDPLGVVDAGRSKDLSVVGDYAYVLGDDGGVKVVDLRNPRLLRLVAVDSLPAKVQAMAVVGSTAYFATFADRQARLQIYDVSDPRSPKARGQANVLGAKFLAVDAGAAYLGGGDNRLQVVDVRDPDQPTVLGARSMLAPVRDLAAGAGAVYVADGEGGLVILGAAFGPAPTATATPAGVPTATAISAATASPAPTAPTPTASPVPNGPRQVALASCGQLGGNTSLALQVVGRYAYLGIGLELVVADVSDPRSPKRAGSLKLPYPASDFGVSGGTLIVAAGEGGLYTVSLEDPSRPLLAGHLEVTGEAQALVVAGSLVYVASTDGHFEIVDLADPARPRRVGQQAIAWNDYDYPTDVMVHNGVLFVLGNNSGLHAFDVSQPASPRKLGTFELRFGFSLAVAGRFAFVSTYESIEVLDIGTPSTPVGVAQIAAFSHAQLIVAGDFLYGAGSSGFQVVDIRDPLHADIVGVSLTGFSTAAIDLVPGYALLADFGGGLRAVDVRRQERPEEPGALAITRTALSAAVAGDYLFVAAEPDALQVFDVHDAGHPAPVASLAAGQLGLIAAASGTVYGLTYDSELVVVDVTDPLSPVVAGRLGLDGEGLAMVVVGNTVYVAAGSAGLIAVDLSNRSEPRRIASPRVPASAARAYVTAVGVRQADGKVTAVVGTQSNGLFVIDITDPGQPRELGSVAAAGNVADVATNGALAYAFIDEGEKEPGGLIAMDIADPQAPAVVGRLDANWGATESGDLLVHGQRVFIRNGAGVWLVDISDSRLPRHAGRVTGAGWGDLPRPGTATMAVQGTTLFAADALDKLLILDRSNPQDSYSPGALRVIEAGPGHPRQVGTLDAEGPAWSAIGVAASGGLAYVAAQYDGLRVVDTHLPAQPTEVDASYLTPWTQEVRLVGDQAFALNYAGFQVFDATERARPRLVGQYSAGPQVQAFDVVSATVYLATQSGVEIVDVRDAARPKRLATIKTPKSTQDVVVVGSIAYIAEGEGGFRITAVHNPNVPVQLAVLDMEGTAYQVDVEGHTAYVGVDYKLVAVDVSDPEQPRITSTIALDGYVRDVLAVGAKVFVAIGGAGVRVLDVADPATPRLAGGIDTPGEARSVAVDGDTVYVADDTAGLGIYCLSEVAASGRSNAVWLPWVRP